MMTGALHNTEEYRVWRQNLFQKNINIIPVVSRQVLAFDGVNINVLFPEKSLWEQSFKKINNSSIIFKAVYQDTSFLFTGDMEADGQARLVSQDIQSDVLKFPHHGSADSMNDTFLRAVKPSITVISVGENSFGHPSPRTLRALGRQGLPFILTRDFGDIILESDGQNVLGPISH